MPDKIVNHFVLADGSTAKYDGFSLSPDLSKWLGNSLIDSWQANKVVNTRVGIGNTVNTTPVSKSWCECFVEQCQSGDSFIINGEGLYVELLWAFVDSNDKLLSCSSENAVGTDLVLFAPKNADKLIVNRWAGIATSTDCYKGAYIDDRLSQYEKAKLYKGILYDFNSVSDAGVYAVTPETSNIPNLFGGYGFVDVDIINSQKYATLYPDRGSSVSFGNSKWYRPLRQQKITLIGDSHTQANASWSRWIQTFLEADGATVQNLGIGGTGFARESPSGAENTYISRIPQINNDVDIICVSGSFNDMSAGKTIGNPSDNTDTTVLGMVNLFFDALLSAFPDKIILCYTTLPWSAYHRGVERSDTYVDGLETICKHKGIAFCSAYDTTPMRPWDAEQMAIYYTNDSHPNTYGQAYWYKRLRPFFMQNVTLYPW